MGRSLVSLGANIGDPLATIRQAADQLRRELNCDASRFSVSRPFRTPPVGGPTGQPPFVNAVAAIESDVDPWDLWEVVRRLELQFGRERNRRWEARKIDLDILLCDDLRIWTPHLKIPHPRMCMRRFILVPATDVAADWSDPVSKKTLGELSVALERSPGNLVLVGRNQLSAISILEEVARKSVASWRTVRSPPDRNESASSLSATDSATRWVSFLPYDDLARTGKAPSAKLAVFLAEPTPSDDIAWEDYHRELAAQLNLLPNTADRFPLDGPRYLLSSDNRDWVVHELVAALEAMDCPVEPLA